MDYAGSVDKFSESIAKLNISSTITIDVDEGLENDITEKNSLSPDENKTATNCNNCTLEKKKDIEEAPGISFYPPVYIQRYNAVRETIEKLLEMDTTNTFPVTLVEFGCAEIKLHQHIKNINSRIQKLVYVDKDQLTLETNKRHIRPLAYEYLRKRETPLRVEVYCGCATQVDPRIVDGPSLYAVIGIEIIEHLDPDILTGFERTVFGVLRPPVVILTTPNAEFNVVFKMAPNTFRHWDHRFEWTRQEFNTWCFNICTKYPGYTYEVTGVGAGPPQTYQLGCVSQMAIFRKTPDAPALNSPALFGVTQRNCYQALAWEDYPFFVDTTPKDEQIYRAFKWHIENYVLNYSKVEEYRIEEKIEVTLSLDSSKYISGMPKNVTGVDEIRMALIKHGYNLRMKYDPEPGWEIVLKVPDYEWSDNDEDDDEEYEMESEQNYNQLPDLTESPPVHVQSVETLDDEEW